MIILNFCTERGVLIWWIEWTTAWTTYGNRTLEWTIGLLEWTNYALCWNGILEMDYYTIITEDWLESHLHLLLSSTAGRTIQAVIAVNEPDLTDCSSTN